MINHLEEIELHPLENYENLIELYAGMLQPNTKKSDIFGTQTFDMSSHLSYFAIEKLKKFCKEATSQEWKQHYMYHILACSLFSNNLEEYNQILKDREKMDTTMSALGLDFRTINNLVKIEDNDNLTILADDQADSEVCRILTTGLTEVVKLKFPKLSPKPKIFLLRGKGPSPYFVDLNCAFLMIGHYQGTDYERKVFQTSVPHELTHIENGKFKKVSIERSMQGKYKFFDEGLAIQNSYSSLRDCNLYFAKFMNSAFLISRYTKYSTLDIMENWENLLFQEKHIPAYDYACSYVNFLDHLFHPKTCTDFFRTWLSQTKVTSILDFFEVFYQVKFENTNKDWLNNLKIYSHNSVFTNTTLITLIESNPLEQMYQYDSDHDLWPETNIFCISKQDKLLKLKTSDNNQFRYQKKGYFSVQANREELSDVTFIILFLNNVEIIMPGISMNSKL